ncbi:hypothetical protein SADUNF_Sadunf06G0081000 [Salix dunnii]|uniref:Retrotransposon Copia-like N-terminal domain-containing protein n=1 Tax=Salix dunnii TaxID=1413687 RepID=A0A835N2U9_9ROSI|nr:hypothetical protein SADUNF_Sadunf06G0081000 [Salix dunnii]
MASSSAITESNTAPITFTFPSINHLISVKLDGSNYLSWVSQFLPVLRSNDLLGIVDGSDSCPSKFLVDSHGKETLTVDPKFIVWTKKDQYLLSWLNATLSESILPTVFGLNTAKEVWDSMANRFAAHNRSRISHLKRQLQNLQQGNKTCADYVQIAKGLANQLAAVGKPIEDDDLISYIIGGLSGAYNSFITSFSFATRDISLSFNDFQSELLSYEALLENQMKSVPPEAGQFALFNQYQHRGSSGFNKKQRHRLPRPIIFSNDSSTIKDIVGTYNFRIPTPYAYLVSTRRTYSTNLSKQFHTVCRPDHFFYSPPNNHPQHH